MISGSSSGDRRLHGPKYGVLGQVQRTGSLAPTLASRAASLKVKGKVYSACVQCVLTYSSETWPMRAEDMRRLERAAKMMIK